MKDFNLWNENKKELDKQENIKYFREWQIWYISMWINIWFEQDWKWKKFERPILILKKFNKDIFLGIPTTTIKKNQKFYFNIWKIKWKENYLILSQIRLFSSKRLINIIWWINKILLKQVKQKISKIL